MRPRNLTMLDAVVALTVQTALVAAAVRWWRRQWNIDWKLEGHR